MDDIKQFDMWVVIYRYPGRNEIVGYFLDYNSAVACYRHALINPVLYADNPLSVDLLHLTENLDIANSSAEIIFTHSLMDRLCWTVSRERIKDGEREHRDGRDL